MIVVAPVIVAQVAIVWAIAASAVPEEAVVVVLAVAPVASADRLRVPAVVEALPAWEVSVAVAAVAAAVADLAAVVAAAAAAVVVVVAAEAEGGNEL